MMRKFLLSFLIISLSAFSQAIVGESDSLEFKEGKIVYKGNVKLTKDGGVLSADKVEVFVDEKGKPKKLVATGNVRYIEGRRKAKADYGEYDLISEKLILKGNARVEDKGNLLEADIIVYNKRKNSLEAKAVNKRVRTVYIEEEKAGE